MNVLEDIQRIHSDKEYRDKRIRQELAKGALDNEVARVLGLTPRQAEYHRKRMGITRQQQKAALRRAVQ